MGFSLLLWEAKNINFNHGIFLQNMTIQFEIWAIYRKEVEIIKPWIHSHFIVWIDFCFAFHFTLFFGFFVCFYFIFIFWLNAFPISLHSSFHWNHAALITEHKQKHRIKLDLVLGETKEHTIQLIVWLVVLLIANHRMNLDYALFWSKIKTIG